MKKYALITGASKGIGREFALILAASGYQVLLVARSESELSALSDQIKQEYAVSAHYLSCDLAQKNAAKQVFDWSQTISAELSILINNAGYGLYGEFEVLPLHEQSDMLQLNIQSVIELTHHFLQALRKSDQAYILHVSSTAAYQSMPTLALYAASKSFILSYSRALNYELKDSNISVSCLCPGPTATGFATRAGLDAFADLAEKFNMSAQAVASAGIKGMFNRKKEIIPGFTNKLSAFGARHLPKSLIERISAGLYKK